MLGSIGLVFLGSTGLLVAQTPEGRLDAISWIVVGSIYIMYFSIYFVAGIGLVLAVKHVRMIFFHFKFNKFLFQRDHNRMKLIMIIMIIGIFVAFLS